MSTVRSPALNTASTPVGRTDGVTESNTDARQQFVDTKRLRQVVIRAEVQGRDLLSFRAADGEDDYRRVTPLADTADDFRTLHVGQAEVEKYHIGPCPSRAAASASSPVVAEST